MAGKKCCSLIAPTLIFLVTHCIWHSSECRKKEWGWVRRIRGKRQRVHPRALKRSSTQEGKANIIMSTWTRDKQGKIEFSVCLVESMSVCYLTLSGHANGSVLFEKIYFSKGVKMVKTIAFTAKENGEPWTVLHAYKLCMLFFPRGLLSHMYVCSVVFYISFDFSYLFSIKMY